MRIRTSTEQRLYLWFRVDADALRRHLPEGWAPQPATGPLEGANLALVLIEGIAASDPQGRPLPDVEHFAVVAVPARNERADAAGFVVIDGLAAPAASAPGAYGVYRPARVAIERRSRVGAAPSGRVEESWDLESEAGDRIRLRVAYARGPGLRRHIEPRIYAGPRPETYRIYKVDQVDDLIHSVHPGGRRAEALAFSAAGGALSDLGAGPDAIVGIVAVPSYYREIVLPTR